MKLTISTVCDTQSTSVPNAPRTNISSILTAVFSFNEFSFRSNNAAISIM